MSIAKYPQGSLLGRLLFLAFENDLPDRGMSKSFGYSDVFNIVGSNPVNLGINVERIWKWCKENLMSINLTKNEALPIKGLPDLRINDFTFGTSTTIKDLGLIVSSDLSWSAHTKQRASKSLIASFFLTRSLSATTLSNKKMLTLATWFPTEATDRRFGNPTSPILRYLKISSERLWCGSQHELHQLQGLAHQVEHSPTLYTKNCTLFWCSQRFWTEKWTLIEEITKISQTRIQLETISLATSATAPFAQEDVTQISPYELDNCRTCATTTPKWISSSTTSTNITYSNFSKLTSNLN